MPQRRIFVDGAIYFVTTRTFDKQSIFSSNIACRSFIDVLDFCRDKLRFELFAFAILPEHVHLLIRSNPRNSISDTVRHIKGRFARLINNSTDLSTEDKFLGCRGIDDRVGEEFILAYLSDNDYRLTEQAEGMRVWQRSFYDRIIRCDRHLENTINYIDNNAVHHQLVDDPIKWPYSSYHNHYQTGKEIMKIDYFEN